MGKKMRIRTGARTASKVQEKALISKAKKLSKNPELIIPECQGDCSRCVFERTKKQIERIQAFEGDKKKLSKLAKSGDQLARAYAATLLLTHEEKAPYLAVFRTPMGEIAFALRGKVKKEKLIGVQHFDNPKWRLLCYMDLVKKKKIHLYSIKERLVCTGKEAKPPRNFVDEMLKGLRYNLIEKEGIFSCNHLKAEEVKKGSSESGTYLRVEWLSGGVSVGICRRCCAEKSNIVSSLSQNMAVPHFKDDFKIKIPTQIKCRSDCETCNVKKSFDLDSEALDKYYLGTSSDQEFVEGHLERYLQHLENLEGKLFILDEECFGNDIEKFIEALEPNREEKAGLEVILSKVNSPIVVTKATSGKVLSLFWKQHGEDALIELIGDEEKAEALFKKSDITDITPSQILKEAYIYVKERDIITSLPEYEKLPAIAKFADNIARIFLTRGKEDAIRAVERYKGGETRIKSVAYAFLLAFEHGASKRWQYTKTEIDFANFLKDFVRDLLNSKPEEYHENLQRLLNATGSTKKLVKKKEG